MVGFNPYSYEFHEDPFSVYRQLRDEAPAYYNEELGFWALSRYDDVLAALHDPDVFCSKYGITLEDGNPIPMMLTTDPPDHTALRRLVSRAFTPRRIADLEPNIRKLSTEYLDALAGQAQADLIPDYAALLPMDVISTLLGVPAGDQQQLRQWSDALLHREEGVAEVPPDGIQAAYNLFKYFSAFLADKRAHPGGDDLAEALNAAEVDGERLSDDQIVGFLFLLIIVGNETTTKLLGNCLIALQRYPAERAKVRADLSRIPAAIEEILRYEGSTQAMARTLTADVEMHGHQMREGDKVLLLLGSGNRDERVWNDPDVYDIDRAWPTHHLAFGHGIHVCLGAALARLEMRVSLEEFITRYPDYEIDESRLVRVHSGNVRGYSHARPSHFDEALVDEIWAMSDHNEIVALIHEYAYRLDIGDLDGVAELFANAELRSTRHDLVRRGAEDARGLYDGVIIYDDGTPRTMHQLTNVTVTVDGDEATGRTYFTVLGMLEDGLHPILAGEYGDRFARTATGWEFRERVFDPKLFGDLSRHMKRETE